jgi:hypothetical protein
MLSEDRDDVEGEDGVVIEVVEEELVLSTFVSLGATRGVWG